LREFERKIVGALQCDKRIVSPSTDRPLGEKLMLFFEIIPYERLDFLFVFEDMKYEG
jgi:hypothetical protein